MHLFLCGVLRDAVRFAQFPFNSREKCKVCFTSKGNQAQNVSVHPQPCPVLFCQFRFTNSTKQRTRDQVQPRGVAVRARGCTFPGLVQGGTYQGAVVGHGGLDCLKIIPAQDAPQEGAAQRVMGQGIEPTQGFWVGPPCG